MTTSIPQVIAPKIGQSDDGSATDTKVKLEETSIKKDTDSKDLAGFEKRPVDTTEPVDSELSELKKQITELNRKTSDKERRIYEARRQKVAKDPDKILEIYEEDPEQANAITKSLWGDQGFNSVDDLISAAEKQKEENKITDPEVLKIKKDKDVLRKEVDSLKESLAKKDDKENLEQLYLKYPHLAPLNDPENAAWNKFKKEFDSFGSHLSVFERAEKANKLAFGDIDEESTRDLQKSLGNLPSGGVSQNQKSVKVSKEALRISEVSGINAETIEKYSNYFNK